MLTIIGVYEGQKPSLPEQATLRNNELSLSPSIFEADLLIGAPESLPTFGTRDASASGHLRFPAPPPPTRELETWLPALRSYFNLRNHPFGEAQRADILRHDFTHELLVAQQSFRRALSLALRVRPDVALSPEADEFLFEAHNPATNERATDAASLTVALHEALSDLCGLCDELLRARPVSLAAWTNFGNVVARELSQVEPRVGMGRLGCGQLLREQQPELLKLTERIVPGKLGDDLNEVFAVLTRMLEHLSHVDVMLRRDAPLKQTLPVFTLLHQETRALIQMLEAYARQVAEGRGKVFDALDGISYAVGMEAVKVFTHELGGLAALRQPPAIYAKVENAHGLLRDCFQQSTVALAQIFEPSMDGARLFQTFRTKLQQSLDLRDDLWVLMQLTRRAEQDGDRRPLAPLLELLHKFRDGNLRCLMYKDWDAFERFVTELAETRGAAEAVPVLHRFGTYLETLFGQINMRVVLIDYPFAYPTLD